MYTMNFLIISNMTYFRLYRPPAFFIAHSDIVISTLHHPMKIQAREERPAVGTMYAVWPMVSLQVCGSHKSKG